MGEIAKRKTTRVESGGFKSRAVVAATLQIQNTSTATAMQGPRGFFVMARVNIEEKVFADPRFRALALKLGDEEKAMGRLVFVFRMAQEYWADDGKLIPTEIWDIYDYKILETVGFAERTPDGIYIKGIAERADWLRKKVAAGKIGGRRSVEARLEKFGTSLPINASNNEKSEAQSEAQSEAPPKHPPKPLTLTPTLNKIHLMSLSTDTPAAKPKKKADTESLLFEAWNQHCGSLAKARGMSAKRRASEAARLKDNPSKEYWVEVITRIAASSFCLGKLGGSWRADFDWLLKPDTHLKVLEGKYDDKTQKVFEDTPEAMNEKYGVRVL